MYTHIGTSGIDGNAISRDGEREHLSGDLTTNTCDLIRLYVYAQ